MQILRKIVLSGIVLSEERVRGIKHEINTTAATHTLAIRHQICSAKAITSWLSTDLGACLALFVMLRLLCSVYPFALAQIVPLGAPCVAASQVPSKHDTGLDFLLTGVWQRNDACAYEQTATIGYPGNDVAVAFFPLFPLLMRIASLPLGLHLTLSGLSISAIAYIFLVVGLRRLLRQSFSDDIAARATLYLSVFPTAVFLFAPYTEALFLALSVWTLYQARQGNWLIVAVLGLLAGFSRAQGILLVMPLAWEFFTHWRAGSQRLVKGVVVFAPVLSFGLFTIYAKQVVGLTPFEGQQGWGMEMTWPWRVMESSWRFISTRGNIAESFNLLLFIFAIALLIVGARRLPMTYLLYALPQIVLIGIRHNGLTPLQSTSRLLIVIFPLFVVLALLLQTRRAHYLWLIISFLGFLFVLTCYIGGVFIA